MKPDQWEQVKLLFEQARQLEPAGWEAFLERQECDEFVRAEVSSLLAVYQEVPEFLAEPAARPAAEVDEDLMKGRVLGPWRLLRELGHGGMGVVWEAERADGSYEQRVAIKLLRSGSATQAGIVRFREERRILAFLDHPSIARLLDGGTTEQGTPYLVMEYVKGEPIDQWCERTQAPLAQRLRLFLAVCEAVDYAHRRLVIHRDLKPANLLVTEDGSPKLLDFGIAKLMDPEEGADGATGRRTERLLTPGFASPEQVRGEPARTASDIYSLGVLLYTLAARRRPYGEDSNNPLEAIRAVLEVDPPAPSAAAGPDGRALQGELDDIILLAMRKNPDQRYLSVQAFADDIRAWLEGRPVAAHPEPWWRRAVKFVRRNRTLSAVAAIAVVSILAGSAVSIWQAQVARRERIRAENNFREVRQFSRAVLFELNEAIRNLPGSTPARLLLVRCATEMLDNLSRTAATDVELMLELAEGYRRVGQIQGSTFSDNLGQVDAALLSLRKAVRLAEGAVQATGGAAGASIVLQDAYEDLADAVLPGNPVESDDIYKKYEALVERIDKLPRQSDKVRFAVATGYNALAFHHVQRSQFGRAKDDFRRAVQRFEALSNAAPVLREWRAQYAFALKRLGAILITENVLEEAELIYGRALALEDEDVKLKPGDKRTIIDRTMTLSDLALIQKKRHRLDVAQQSYEEVVRLRADAMRADPMNHRLLRLTVSAELNLASVYALAGRYADAVELARTALRQREEARRRGVDLPWEVAVAEMSLACHLVSAAEHVQGAQRNLLLVEGATLLHRAAPVLSAPLQAQRTRAQQDAWAEFLDVREKIARLSGAGAPR